MNELNQLINKLTPEIYRSLKRAIELGKWPDGRALSPEQRSLCLQAVIAYEHEHLPPEERTGYIAPRPHTHCASDQDVPDADVPLKWQ